MTETELAALCAAITPPDKAARAAAHAHWASLAKPLGGLGGLETTIEDAAALTGSAKLDISRRAVLVLCADNGVVAQGVSQTDSSVTRAVAENLAARRTSVCRMAQTARCEVVPVDMGIAGDPVPGVLDCRIAPGTADFTLGPAMSRAEAVEAIGRGIRLVQEQKKAGVGLLATGEMGIGNTTTSSAVAAVLLGQPVEVMTGRGAGLSDEGLARKIDAIHRGIAKNQPSRRGSCDDGPGAGRFRTRGLPGRSTPSIAASQKISPTLPMHWTCWRSWAVSILPGSAASSSAGRWKVCRFWPTVSSAVWRRSALSGSARQRPRLFLQAIAPPSRPQSWCWTL